MLRKLWAPPLAIVFALCAALAPSQAWAGALTTRASFSNPVAVFSCTFTVEAVDNVAGTIRYKVTANARPVGFQGLTTRSTQSACAVYDSGFNLLAAEYFAGGTTINQTRRITVATSLAPYHLCGQGLVEKKNGTFVGTQVVCA